MMEDSTLVVDDNGEVNGDNESTKDEVRGAEKWRSRSIGTSELFQVNLAVLNLWLIIFVCVALFLDD